MITLLVTNEFAGDGIVAPATQTTGGQAQYPSTDHGDGVVAAFRIIWNAAFNIGAILEGRVGTGARQAFVVGIAGELINERVFAVGRPGRDRDTTAAGRSRGHIATRILTVFLVIKLDGGTNIGQVRL